MNKILPFKGRTLNTSKPVHIYRNLNGDDQHKYSIRQGGLVVGHTTQIFLKDCEFKVSKKGQLRVRKNKRKNVHAYIKGRVINRALGVNATAKLPSGIGYNPYKNDFFMCSDFPIHQATWVIINKHGVTTLYNADLPA